MTIKYKSELILFLVILAVALSSGAFAAVYDFENGTDAQPIAAGTPGVVFEPTLGRQWLFGDWRTGKYDGPYPDGPYFSEGNFFAWMGVDGNTGKISFVNGASRFALSYSSPDAITLDGYSSTNALLDSETGTPNLNSGEMGLLTVEAANLAYIVIGVGSMGNYWLIDNIDTDAIEGCLTNADCDDGVFCNGEEICDAGDCFPGTPIDCPDDAKFCNGEEFCDEEAKACGHRNAPVCEDDGLFCNGAEKCVESERACGHAGDPCDPGEECNEVLDMCTLHGEADDDTTANPKADEAGWPEGKVTGGCCGCS